jgi:hypothetical protein
MPPDRVAASALRAEAARPFLCDGATTGRLTPIRHILLSCRETQPDGARRDRGYDELYVTVAGPGQIGRRSREVFIPSS